MVEKFSNNEYLVLVIIWLAQLTGAEEYTDCISAEEYNIKSSDGKAPALEIWGMWSIISLP